MLTGKQEKFAQEVAKERKSHAEAYRLAYETKNMSNEAIYVEACRLMDNPKVSLRIKELQEEALLHVNYDIEAHYKELEELRQLALVPRGDNGNIEINSAIKATELKGKLKGLYIERKDVTVSEFNLFTKKVKEKEQTLKDA
jgi:phage terminase small subunit